MLRTSYPRNNLPMNQQYVYNPRTWQHWAPRMRMISQNFFKIPFQGPSRPIRDRTMALRLYSLSPDVVPLSRPLYPQFHWLTGRRYPKMTHLQIKPYNMYIAVFCQPQSQYNKSIFESRRSEFMDVKWFSWTSVQFMQSFDPLPIDRSGSNNLILIRLIFLGIRTKT